MLCPRFGCAAVSIAGHVFVVGGHGAQSTMAETEFYNPAVGTWHSLPPMPVPRHRCGAVAAGDKIYVFGGSSSGQEVLAVETFVPRRWQPGSDELWDSWDAQSDNWNAIGSMASPRDYCRAVAVAG